MGQLSGRRRKSANRKVRLSFSWRYLNLKSNNLRAKNKCLSQFSFRNSNMGTSLHVTWLDISDSFLICIASPVTVPQTSPASGSKRRKEFLTVSTGYGYRVFPGSHFTISNRFAHMQSNKLKRGSHVAELRYFVQMQYLSTLRGQLEHECSITHMLTLLDQSGDFEAWLCGGVVPD